MNDTVENKSAPTQSDAPSQKTRLLKFTDVSLLVPTISVKKRQFSINPMRIMAQFYANSSKRNFQALLLNLNFSVYSGERIGVIGKNGAGKTTFLRLIAGVYKPSNGTIELSGKAHGLFNIQLGMNPNATGIENIYLRGLQMGLTLAQIRERIDEVSKFTELGDSLNDVFGNYSTGMKLRLAFAISTSLRPDILLMDEWIGSGDANFKDKVAGRMNELVADSKSLIVASHNKALLHRLCTRAVVLDSGKIVFSGSIEDALAYHSMSQKKALEQAKASLAN